MATTAAVAATPAAAPLPAVRTFRHFKDTQNKSVFAEEPAPGEAPIVGNLYIAKWWNGSGKLIKVTIEKLS